MIQLFNLIKSHKLNQKLFIIVFFNLRGLIIINKENKNGDKNVINYIIENKFITNAKTEEELIEIFNKKWATIILSLESKLGGCNLA